MKLPARIEPFRVGKLPPPLPELTARHVYDWLMEAGPIQNGAMGQAPLSWGEIDRWASGTSTRLSAWDRRMLRRLSTEYLSELHAAEDHTRPAPWSPVGAEVDRKSEEQRLRAVLG